MRVTMCDTLNQGFEWNGTYITKYHRFKNCKTKPVEHSVTSMRFQGFCTTLNTQKVRVEWVSAQINEFYKHSPTIKNTRQDFVLDYSLLFSYSMWSTLFLAKPTGTEGCAKTVFRLVSCLWSPYEVILESSPPQNQAKNLRKGMDFNDLAKHQFKANFVRIKSCVKPLKPRTRDTVFHRFSFTVFKTVILCDIGSISLKSLI